MLNKVGFLYILDSSYSVHSHFDLVSSVSALDATKLAFQPVTQMTVEMINWTGRQKGILMSDP